MSNFLSQLYNPQLYREFEALADRLCGPHVFPARCDVLSFLDLGRDPSVVILGQDPYHTPGKANGRAFGYHPDYRGPIDASMRNIIQEVAASGYPEVLEHDEKRGVVPSPYWDLTLRSWTLQGVLLLNSALTVREGAPLSHAYQGWQSLVQRLLALVARQYDPVFLLWGRSAQSLFDITFLDHGDRPHPVSIRTSHPSPFSASKGSSPFLGSKCFRDANEVLASMQRPTINWGISTNVR
jgi:uracil-DNA glycosylase